MRFLISHDECEAVKTVNNKYKGSCQPAKGQTGFFENMTDKRGTMNGKAKWLNKNTISKK